MGGEGLATLGILTESGAFPFFLVQAKSSKRICLASMLRGVHKARGEPVHAVSWWRKAQYRDLWDHEGRKGVTIGVAGSARISTFFARGVSDQVDYGSKGEIKLYRAMATLPLLHRVQRATPFGPRHWHPYRTDSLQGPDLAVAAALAVFLAGRKATECARMCKRGRLEAEKDPNLVHVHSNIMSLLIQTPRCQCTIMLLLQYKGGPSLYRDRRHWVPSIHTRYLVCCSKPEIYLNLDHDGISSFFESWIMG